MSVYIEIITATINITSIPTITTAVLLLALKITVSYDKKSNDKRVQPHP